MSAAELAEDIGEITGRLPDDPWNDLYEQLVLKATDGGRSPALAEARRIYFERTGPVHADDEDYTLRMSLFLDWFVFGWNADGAGTRGALILEAEQSSEFALFSAHRHSLFTVLGSKGELLKVKDWIAGEKLQVRAAGLAPYLNKDMFFETRLVYEGGGTLHLVGPVCDHSELARKPIRKAIKRLLKETKKDPNRRARLVEALLFDLRELRVRTRQYAHVRPVKIYEEGLEKFWSREAQAA